MIREDRVNFITNCFEFLKEEDKELYSYKVTT